MKDKTAALKAIYAEFEEKTREFKADKACEKGCAFCCTQAGSIDVTTLEGMQIRAAIKAFPKSRQKTLTRALQQEMRSREKKQKAACPFLMKNKGCMIYEVRPFSCRRIYSVHRCSAAEPPAMSRQVMAVAAAAIKSLQQLDDTGYSGHISYIMHMLATPAFLKTYVSGDFKPQEIMVFGKTHAIAINRMMT